MTTSRKRNAVRLASHHPALLAFVHRHCFATAQQLQQRFPDQLGTLRTAQKHAKALVDRGLLARAPVRAVLPTFPHVFFTTARGRKVVGQAYQEQTGRPWPESRGQHHRRRPYSVTYIEHELAMTNIDLAVHRTVAARPDITLAHVQRRFAREMSCEHAGWRIAVQPDARYDQIHRRGKIRWLDVCFVELDRGTSSAERWWRKLRRYEVWASSAAGRRYLKRLHRSYGDRTTKRPNFRLLVIAQARVGEGDDFGRLSRLLRECLKLSSEMQARIWAACYSDVQDDINGAVWYRWRDSRRWRGRFEPSSTDLGQRDLQQFVTERLKAMNKYTLLPPRLT